MRLQLKKKPREFRVGLKSDIAIKDFGKILLEKDEMVSFVTASGKEHDFVAKSWGFYATPSINGRLKDQGFKCALASNSSGRFYLLVVERDKIKEFMEYLDCEKMKINRWLDDEKA